MSERKQIIIIGGVAGGASAAARASDFRKTLRLSYLNEVTISPLPIAECHIISAA